MSNLSDSYTATYGTDAKVFLRTLGGNPDKILTDLSNQCTAPNPLSAMLGADASATAGDAHNAILREIKRIYFSGLPRETALAVANSLSALGTISLCAAIPELTFNAWSYADAWSEANPDQRPIQSAESGI